jgi:uncharacterized membrane protein
MLIDSWVEYLLRFSHLVAGIAWIGSSFYFIWLDSSFAPPGEPRRNVDGELFMVHGGFYYQVEKRKIYPGELPATLHWFKWEATLTWVTGFLLFIVLYYLRGASLLIDSQVHAFTPAGAIVSSLGLLAGSWLAYDFIWHPNIGFPKGFRGLLSVLFFGGLIFLLTRLYSGRGAFIMMGAIFGTMMLLNVWFRILPGQKKMIKEAEAGQVPDYSVSLKSKVRSVHNTYFIFPVLFIMLSNHYPAVYGHPLNWLLLILLSVAGATARHAMVTKNPVERWVLAPGAAALIAAVFLTAMPPKPRSAAVGAGPPVGFAQVQSILASRCWQCHSSNNTDDIYKTAPRGILFENEQQMREKADKIQMHVIVAKSMPLANKTQMTDAERDVIGRWLSEQGLVQAH